MHRRSPILSLLAVCSLAGLLHLAACSGSSGDGVSNVPGGVNNTGGAGASSAGAPASAGAALTAGAPSAGAGGAPTTPTAGAAGAVTAGAGGADTSAGGTAGAAMSGGGANGTHPTGPSAGCGKTFADPFVTAVEHDMTVKVDAEFTAKYASRKYYTQLPKSYDGMKPLPVVFYGQGCGQSGPESSGFSDVMNTDGFLLVQMIPIGGCYEAGKSGSLNSPDGPYFDQALSEVEANYCIDKSKVYVAGWSSGAWISTYLACTRGGVIRAAATVAGGLQHAHPTCVGGAGIIMYIGNGDNENGVVDMVNGFDVGTGQSRDTFIKTNGCSATSTAWDAAFPTCQIYGGCDNPVIWCPVDGGHGAGNDKLPSAAWKFWGSLK